MKGFLSDKNKSSCFGCEACVQACPKEALMMKEDEEGFRYPILDENKCIKCNICHNVCPYENTQTIHKQDKYVFGGYIKDENTRFESTSGGAFSAIVDTFCDENYVIFGAEADGIYIWHSYISDKRELEKYRKSKYLQSVMGDSYIQVKKFLQEEKKVLFSGTPCQIAALKTYLGNTNQDRLLTVEVICEGVPSPLYMRKYEEYLKEKYDAKIISLDYRYKGRSFWHKYKWDFEVMKIILSRRKMIGGNKKRKNEIVIEKDRWFNPFWSVWLKHLMSRPSCYECPFAKRERVADISLGDLWGVHLYCPELYGKNGGSSLAIANTQKGKEVLVKSQKKMYGHELNFEKALKYQSPMRKHIDKNDKRVEFMNDLQSEISFKSLNKKWATRPSPKLLYQKYIWGNRQKIWLWNIRNKKKRRTK